jgi:SAM-dependent methyltransferase
MDYDLFSDIYDYSCPGVEGDIQFFLNKGRTKRRILEIGCGNGRVYLPLRAEGFNIVGIDSSKKMLDLLEDRAVLTKTSVEVYQQSMLDMNLEGTFDLVILAYRTFMHLYSIEDQQLALRQIKSLLAPDGEVVIDLFNPDKDRVRESSYFLLEDKDPKKLVWLWEEFDQQNQIVKNIFRLEEYDENGLLRRTLARPFKARWTYPNEMRILAEELGFCVKSVLAAYDGSLFTGSEDKMIWILSLAKGE